MSDARLKPSHRSTTSSRTPGRVNQGTVWSIASALVRCEDCAVLTTDFVAPGRHGTHWHDGVLVNCAGKPVPP